MNKTELVNKISEVAEVNKKQAKAVIDVLPDIIKDAVADGDKVSITGFITFEKKDVEEKSGTVQLGDKKGETWTTPAHSEVKAKLSKSYKML